MRAVEHYQEAERLIADVTDSEGNTGPSSACAAQMQLAALHATLALAGATALQSYARVGDSDGELADWEAAAGGDDE
jgi:hypothetical protein